mmetsp:Transcript_50136/g.162427  ORF Transcript_50136/g.162427 Transcript_50136/m.162427 type:complete len:478 (-) Transcript_50136:716-2149(-)
MRLWVSKNLQTRTHAHATSCPCDPSLPHGELDWLRSPVDCAKLSSLPGRRRGSDGSESGAMAGWQRERRRGSARRGKDSSHRAAVHGAVERPLSVNGHPAAPEPLEVRSGQVAVGACRVKAERLAELEHLIRAVDVVLRGGRLPPNHAREESGHRACGPVRKARVERLKHELVRRVVADAEDEVDAAHLRVELRYDVVDHRALVDPLGPHLYVALAGDDGDGAVCEHRVKVHAHLLGLHQPELGVDFVELPHQGRALDLCLRAVGAHLVRLHHGGNLLLPRQVVVWKELPPLGRVRPPHAWERAEPVAEAVLRGEGGVAEGREGGVHPAALLPREHHQQVARVRGELVQAGVHSGREALAEVLDEVGGETVLDRDERPAPIEEERPPAGPPVRREHLGRVERGEVAAPAGAVEAGEPKADRLPLRIARLLLGDRLQVEHESLGPRRGGVVDDELHVTLPPRVALGLAHGQAAAERLG